MPGNPPQLDHLEGLALEYARIPHWQDRMLGCFHPSKRKRFAAWARHGVSFHGRMVYTEGPQRSELFHRSPGRFEGAHADCSQYGSACGEWSGIKGLDAADWTGTLWDKGKVLLHPIVGCGVIFGPKPGVHFGIVTGRRNGAWLVSGFGTQTGPDTHTLPDLVQYFLRVGHPGTRYIDLAR